MRQFFLAALTLLGYFSHAQSITSAEYFFNTDPGVGGGTTLTVNGNAGVLTQTFTISTVGLQEGFNSLYIRTFNDDNNWGLYDRQTFYLKSFTAGSIVDAEYFFDLDPGVGLGQDLTVNSNSGELTQTYAIPTGSLSPGFHSIYLRTQGTEGNWSLYDRQSFYLQAFDSFNIISAEYFFNTDPGIGGGTVLPVDANSGQIAQTYSISIAGLDPGFNSFYVRTQSNNNEWSLYDRQIIYIQDFDFSPDLVSSAEYFIDSDPGIGNGDPISFGDPSQTSQVLNIDSSGLSLGQHTFYVRVQDTNGDWSIYDSELFTVALPLKISPTALLQGPILNPSTPGLMNDILREDGHLPTTSPYADALSVDPNVFNSGGLSGTGSAADDIVDWVWVELRDSSDNTTIDIGQSALVQRDGDIVDLDGVSELLLNVAPAEYFVAIKHRNHIGTMSLGTILLNDATTTTVDFTNGAFSTFGTDAQVVLGSGDKALWAGNVNSDGTIQYAGAGALDTSSLLAFILNDGSNFLNLPTWTVTGYTNNDVDMNGVTQYTGGGVLDSPYILQNVLSYPGNFLNLSTWTIEEQLPEN